MTATAADTKRRRSVAGFGNEQLQLQGVRQRREKELSRNIHHVSILYN